MSENMEIPRIKMAEVFVDGHCVGFLTNVKLVRGDDGEFDVEGEWSGYADVLQDDRMYTISIPSYECRFLADNVKAVQVKCSGTVSFKGASFLPDGPKSWFEMFGDQAAEA